MEQDLKLIISMMTEMKADMDEMKADMNEMKADMNEMKADITNMKSDITGIKTNIAEMKSDIKSLDERVENVEIQVAKNIDISEKMRREINELSLVKEVSYLTAFKLEQMERNNKKEI